MPSSVGNPIPPGIAETHKMGNRDELLDWLRGYINSTTADGHPSEDLGIHTILAGDPTDEVVPILFRCQWPADARSRHILIWLRPSISDADFGTVLNDQFGIFDSGGAIHKTVVNWARFNPFYHPDGPDGAGLTATVLREEVARSVGLDDPPSLKQVFTMINLSMTAYVEVHVKTMAEMLACQLCGGSIGEVGEWEQPLRETANGVMGACKHCGDRHGWKIVDILARLLNEELRAMSGQAGQAPFGSRYA
ncbi:hypothetical protein MMC11_007820 [Xylographa trunciseda]|nr:hypothetical protein [Xylographa trunciseda]